MDDIPRNDHSGADQENENQKALSSDTKTSEKKLMDAVKKASGKNAGRTADGTQGTNKKAPTGKQPVKKKAVKKVPADSQSPEKSTRTDVQPAKRKSAEGTQPARRKSSDEAQSVKRKVGDEPQPVRREAADETQPVRRKTVGEVQPVRRKAADEAQPVRRKATDEAQPAGPKTSDGTQPAKKRIIDGTTKPKKPVSDSPKSKKPTSDSRKPESADIDLMLDEEDTEQAAKESAARARRRAAAKKAEEERRERITRMISLGLLVIIVILAIVLLTKIFGGNKDEAQQSGAQNTETAAVTAQTDSTNAAATGETASGAAANAAAESTAENPAQTDSTTDLGYDPNNPAGLSDEVLADPRSVNAVTPYVTDWNMESNGTKTVYLTFDDGPSYLTEQFLDVLDTYGVKATFFVTNQSPEYSYLIAEAYQRGHTIGMHTSSHSFEIYKSEEDYFFDLQEIANVVHDQIGYVPCFIRFPGGSSNTRSARYSQGIMAKLAEEVQARGYQYYDWNGECGDGEMLSAEEEVAIALDCSAENIIMLCHDGPMKEATLEALPGIIEGYMERGYVFAPIDRDTMVVHHEILN